MRAPQTAAAARFRAAYDDTYADVLRFALRRVPPALAEDVVADTMLTAWRRVDDLPGDPDARRAWVFGIARHCLLNVTRGARRSDALAVRIAEVDVGRPSVVEDRTDLVDLQVDLARAWARLSDGEQEVLALTVFDGLDSASAGAVLRISPAAYRLRLSRARRALRELLDNPTADSTTARRLETLT